MLLDEMSFTMYLVQNISITTPTQGYVHMWILFAVLGNMAAAVLSTCDAGANYLRKM